MKSPTIFILCLFVSSCSIDSDQFDLDSESSSSYRETDFNFVLRAIHPSQTVDVRFGDGIRGSRSFRSSVKIFSNGKTNGKATIGNQKEGWQIIPFSSSIDCNEGARVVVLTATLEELSHSRINTTEEVLLTIGSSSSDTDNPECLIWDIKDSSGSSMAEFVADGNIFIDNSSCGITR